MARIVVTTFGSTGDLNPFIALALALRSRGHDVVFAVEANFQQQVSELGFPVRLLTGDQEKALASYSQQIFNNDQPLTSLKILVEHYILPTLPAKVAELREICQQAEQHAGIAYAACYEHARNLLNQGHRAEAQVQTGRLDLDGVDRFGSCNGPSVDEGPNVLGWEDSGGPMGARLELGEQCGRRDAHRL